MPDESLIFSNLISVKNKSRYNCPDCIKPMHIYKCSNKLIYKCGLCEGVWFKKGVFSVFKNTLDSFDLNKIKKIYKPPQSELALMISSCPRCKLTLDEQNYSYNTGVKINRCQRCEGFWLKLYDFLQLVDITKHGQLLQEDARQLVKDVKFLQKFKSNSRNFTPLQLLGGGKKWFFMLTPVAFIFMIIIFVSTVFQYLYIKFLNKQT